MAQVDWTTLRGKTGANVCPSGVTQNRNNLIFFNTIQPGDTSVTVSTATLSLNSLRNWIGSPSATPIRLALWIYENGDKTKASPKSIGEVNTTDTQLDQQTRSFSNLKIGERTALTFLQIPQPWRQIASRCRLI